jgi:hypothetical protein
MSRVQARELPEAPPASGGRRLRLAGVASVSVRARVVRPVGATVTSCGGRRRPAASSISLASAGPATGDPAGAYNVRLDCVTALPLPPPACQGGAGAGWLWR